MAGIIPEGTYTLKFGDSFLNSSSARSSSSSNKTEFNTLRFDFKPGSVSAGSETYIAESQNENDFQVIVPGEEGQRPTIFKGAKKAVKGDKECLLVYDEASGELCLERVSANINVKKTRDVELDKRVRKEIDKLRKEKRKTVPAPEKEREVKEDNEKVAKTVVEKKKTTAEREAKERTISGGSSVGDADEEDEEVAENVSALEQLMAPKSKSAVEMPPLIAKEKKSVPSEEEVPSSSSFNAQSQSQKQTSPTKKHAKSILAEDLELSESSSSSSSSEEEESDGEE